MEEPPPQRQKQQQQQTQQQQNDINDEFLEAQRAAVEAVQVGRETLEQTQRQGEQLSHADRLADQTRYAVEKSARMLRNMTWSGWVANLMSKDVAVVPESSKAPKFSYDDVPVWAASTAQTIQNYKANVTVLAACETKDQLATCQLVCENMYSAASTCIAAVEPPNEAERPVLQKLMQDLNDLRQRQRFIMKQKQDQQRSAANRNREAAEPKATAAAASTSSASLSASRLHQISTEQEEHLDIIGSSLDELNATALSLNEMMKRQNKIMNSLDEKAEENLEKSRMVARRADRMAHSKSWALTKKEFDRCVTIRELATGRYFSNNNKSIVLTETFRPDTCIFEVWKRKSGLFGLKSKFTSRWVGQSLLGNLVCSSTSFGSREEWQTEHNLAETTLLCASAGWGSGGYILVRASDLAVMIGGLETKNHAALWRIDDYLEHQLE